MVTIQLPIHIMLEPMNPTLSEALTEDEINELWDAVADAILEEFNTCPAKNA